MDDPLRGWRWLLWFAIGCFVGLVLVKTMIL